MRKQYEEEMTGDEKAMRRIRSGDKEKLQRILGGDA